MSYWSVDLPGLTQEEAIRVLRWSAQLPGVLGGSVVDPRANLTMHMDRDTVEALYAALTDGDKLEAAAAPRSRGEIVAALAESMREWLDA